jgi:hypothetical protein
MDKELIDIIIKVQKIKIELTLYEIFAGENTCQFELIIFFLNPTVSTPIK